MSQNSHEPSPVTDKLEIHCRQQLSALIDGELPADEARFLLRRLQHDQELAGCLDRWQLTGELLRHQVQIMAPVDFSQRVAAAIASEMQNESLRYPARGRPVWMKWGGGAALVASIVTVALFMNRESPLSTVPLQEVETAVFATQARLPAAEEMSPIDEATSTVAESLVSEPNVVPISERAVAELSAEPVRTAPSSPARPAVRQTVPRRAASDAAAVPIAALQTDRPAPTMSEPGSTTVLADASSSAVDDTTITPATSPLSPQYSRPWPRSSLLQSDSAFNVGFPRQSMSRDLRSFESHVRSEPLFPPATDSSDVTTSQE
ncbi:MAG: hypothetical protein LBV45_10575 [Xanthomonadaceae bacterium]|jgi:negative regulator of sigma E activity|nr:hypothetical protein [Xanthomonadaceae bacterium]